MADKKTTPYDVITDTIIARLESGVIPWQKPWVGANHRPTNLVSRQPYTGINPFLLACAGYGSPYWLTFRQAKNLGGSVRKGEHGTKIVFFKAYDKTDADGEVTDRIRMIRYYTVFNVEQCDGLDGKVPATDDGTFNHDPIAEAEAIANGYAGPTVTWGGDRACYSPTLDAVRMPPRESFAVREAVYATLFHELAHSTGHESRLNRDIANVFGSHQYSKEELVAEMTAAFLCADAGIDTDGLLDNSAAYVKSWIRALRGDSKLVVAAATAAQRAASFIHNGGVRVADAA